MAKRKSEEARLLAYFKTASLDKAELMLGLVREEVKQRIVQERPAKAATHAHKPKVERPEIAQ